MLSPKEVQQSHGSESQALPQGLGLQKGRAAIQATKEEQVSLVQWRLFVLIFL